MSSQSNQPNACETDDDAGGLHQRITDALPHALAFVDAEGVYRAVNAACAELYGRTPAEMVGHAVEAFCPGDLCAAEVASCLERCLAGEEVECQATITGAGGRRRHVGMRYCPSPDATGAVTGVVMHGMDITEQRDRKSVV